MAHTSRQAQAAEMALRSMSKKAFDAYSGISPLTVYEVETENGKRYDTVGAIEVTDATLEDLEEMFEEMADEFAEGEED